MCQFIQASVTHVFIVMSQFRDVFLHNEEICRATFIARATNFTSTDSPRLSAKVLPPSRLLAIAWHYWWAPRLTFAAAPSQQESSYIYVSWDWAPTPNWVSSTVLLQALYLHGRGFSCSHLNWSIAHISLSSLLSSQNLSLGTAL